MESTEVAFYMRTDCNFGHLYGMLPSSTDLDRASSLEAWKSY